MIVAQYINLGVPQRRTVNETKLLEFQRCGRNPGGEHLGDLGICPAAQERRLSGVHGGKRREGMLGNLRGPRQKGDPGDLCKKI